MTVNGTEKPIDAEGSTPVIINDRTLLPVRAVVEEMGGTVAWDGNTQTVTLNYNGDEIELVIDSETAALNGLEQTLDTAPTIINDRTLLPIRFIAESFKFDVDWTQETQTVTITKSESAPTETTPPVTEPSNGSKTLVVYYSATGSTENAANYIAAATNADIFELEPVKPYTDADLDWTDDNSRVVDEHNNEEKRVVELTSTTVSNWDRYNTVFIGYPIWWGIAAWPVDGFVKANDFTGKTVIPFCTSASSGIGESGELLADMAGTGDWQEGMRFRSGVSESDVADWVKTLNLNTSSESKSDSKTLVVYFSQPETNNAENMTQEEDNSTVVIDGEVLGNTQYMAYVIAENTNADIFRIEPETPYPTDHSTLVDLAADEQDQKARPAIKDQITNLDNYDTIFLGYPNWWGDMPMILYTFLESYDLSGKTVIPFNTHGGSGFSRTISSIRSLQPNSNVLEGLSISRNHIQDAEREIVNWVNGLK
ncbi:MAG: flavodoxin [bacterium]|nr:flavodoxin [bacterium]